MSGETMPRSQENLARAGAVIAAGLTLYGVFTDRAERRRRAGGRDDGRGADAASPSEIPAPGWTDILKRVWNQLGEDNVSIIAAGVAFYGLLAIFPALAALVSIYGLIADPVDVQRQIAAAQGFLPQEASRLLADQMQSLVSNEPEKLGIGVLIGILLAIWSATKGTGALITALNIAYEEREKRGMIRLNLVSLALTGGLVLFAAVALLFIAGFPAIADYLPFTTTIKGILSLARWPILAVLVVVVLGMVYRYAPSRDEPRWQWVSWGAAVATVFWIIASIGFSIYVAKFSSYNETYGSIGAVVILLMWFYLSAYVVLVGAELNAEIERQTARDTTKGPERPMGARGARMADTVPQAAE